MKIGTRSILFGAHQFIIHPIFLVLAWLRLYGFKPVRDPYVGEISILNYRLWIAFIVHDLGYWGLPNMDGEEGEMHPHWGASMLNRYFHEPFKNWFAFCFYHSRFLAKQAGRPYSLLCPADKLACALEPRWLYLPRVILSGEIKEYMALAGAKNQESKYNGEPPTKYESAGYDLSTRWAWCTNMQEYCKNWAYEHRDGRQDTWTPDNSQRESVDEYGTYK